MKLKEMMLSSLNHMLNEGETLIAPVYGTLKHGTDQWNAFLGFTENCLLVALFSGDTSTFLHTERVDFNIEYVGIKRSKIFKDYTIDITFKKGGHCQFITHQNVLTVDTQKENFPKFLELLESKAEYKTINLKKVSGERIRCQYFNVFCYIMISYLPMLIIMLGTWRIIDGPSADESFAQILCVTFTTFGIVLLPFIVLSVLNRFLFGKVVCVANDDALVLEYATIPWKDIVRAEYTSELPSRSDIQRCCRVKVIVKSGEDEEYGIDILHFPIYGLGTIKKYAPRAKVVFFKEKALLFVALAPTVIAIIHSIADLIKSN